MSPHVPKDVLASRIGGVTTHRIELWSMFFIHIRGTFWFPQGVMQEQEQCLVLHCMVYERYILAMLALVVCGVSVNGWW